MAHIEYGVRYVDGRVEPQPSLHVARLEVGRIASSEVWVVWRVLTEWQRA